MEETYERRNNSCCSSWKSLLCTSTCPLCGMREYSDISKLAIIKGMSEDAGKLQESALKDIERATKRYIEIVRRCVEVDKR